MEHLIPDKIITESKNASDKVSRNPQKRKRKIHLCK